MENLLREILAPSPIAAPATLPAGPIPLPVTASASEHERPAAPAAEAPSPAARAAETVSAVSVDWEGQVDIQRLLGMLPGAQSDAEVFPSALDLDVDFGMGEWDMGGMGNHEVGVC